MNIDDLRRAARKIQPRVNHAVEALQKARRDEVDDASAKDGRKASAPLPVPTLDEMYLSERETQEDDFTISAAQSGSAEEAEDDSRSHLGGAVAPAQVGPGSGNPFESLAGTSGDAPPANVNPFAGLEVQKKAL